MFHKSFPVVSIWHIADWCLRNFTCQTSWLWHRKGHRAPPSFRPRYRYSLVAKIDFFFFFYRWTQNYLTKNMCLIFFKLESCYKGSVRRKVVGVCETSMSNPQKPQSLQCRSSFGSFQPWKLRPRSSLKSTLALGIIDLPPHQ